MSRRVLFCGDAVVASGFARATHNYCYGLIRAGFEPHVLGINYPGDPHGYPFAVYSPSGGNPNVDSWGIGRIKNLAVQLRPEVIVIQQDPWNFPLYMKMLEGINVPIVGVVAVDGKNCQGDKLNGLTHAIFWTKFAEEQAREGGFTGQSSIIPLGVDRKVYRQLDRAELQREMWHPIAERYQLSPDAFIVGTVGRNQQRKRFDLTIKYFAEWVREYRADDAVLWMHSAPTGDDAYDLKSLARYYGIKGRVLVPDPNPIYGAAEVRMAECYNLFNVFLSTGLGEGWGLPAIEAMSCGTPCELPDWSAYGDWAKDAAALVPCSETMVHPQINTVGGVMEREKAILVLNYLYDNPSACIELRDKGIALASRDEYRWENIGAAFAAVVEAATAPVEQVEQEMEMEEV